MSFKMPPFFLYKMLFIFFFFVMGILSALPLQNILSPHDHDPYSPNVESARSNANFIFNAIHSSMRQWGSSLQHNGMSFYPAYVPEGTLLYHGRGNAEPVTGLEWLAFEIEHAEMFAINISFPRSRTDLVDSPLHHQLRLAVRANSAPGDKLPEIKPGYLHIYRATRPLKRLLYIDGMTAAKSPLGTLDTQDLVLCNSSRNPLFDMQRAQELCKLGSEWDIEGFIRMEAGFEMIKCNFSDGLDFVSGRRRPAPDVPGGYNDMSFFEYMRAVAARYHGIDAGRVVLDYSSMVSAYFYPGNLSNPDPTSDLPRLISSDPEQLSRIRSDLKTTLNQQRTYDAVNWQGIVDLIVTRYSDRLQYLATNPPKGVFLRTINNLLNLFIDYDSVSIQSAIKTCSLHYLQPVRPMTKTDDLIFAAMETVTNRICNTLFDVREELLAKGKRNDSWVDQTGVAAQMVLDLMQWLNWTTWTACGECGHEEVCFVAMWPFGNSEDHYHPRCLRSTELFQHLNFTDYWNPDLKL